MAQLKEVLAGVLRDLVEARVAGDLFSRDVSEEYLKDPILSAFPVPRAEIKEATANLRFTVNSVELPQPDAVKITRDAASAWTARIARELLSETLDKNPLKDELVKLIADKGLKLDRDMAAASETAILADPKIIEAVLAGKPDPLVKAASAELYRVLTTADDDVRKIFQRTERLTPIKERVAELVAARAPSLRASLEQALASAVQKNVKVDLAVTRRELADVAEHTLSSVSVTVAVRNYEWTKSEQDGKEVARLNPE